VLVKFLLCVKSNSEFSNMAFATLSNLFAARCSSLIVALTCVFNCVFCELLVYRWCCPIVCFSLPSLDNRVYKTGSATPTFTGWLWSQFTRAIATTSPVYCRHQPRECDVLSKWYLALWSAWFVFIFTESRTFDTLSDIIDLAISIWVRLPIGNSLCAPYKLSGS